MRVLDFFQPVEDEQTAAGRGEEGDGLVLRGFGELVCPAVPSPRTAPWRRGDKNARSSTWDQPLARFADGYGDEVVILHGDDFAGDDFAWG